MLLCISHHMTWFLRSITQYDGISFIICHVSMWYDSYIKRINSCYPGRIMKYTKTKSLLNYASWYTSILNELNEVPVLVAFRIRSLYDCGLVRCVHANSCFRSSASGGWSYCMGRLGYISHCPHIVLIHYYYYYCYCYEHHYLHRVSIHIYMHFIAVDWIDFISTCSVNEVHHQEAFPCNFLCRRSLDLKRM